jgi:hypothetical protein
MYFAPNVLLACAIVDRYDPAVDGFRSSDWELTEPLMALYEWPSRTKAS